MTTEPESTTYRLQPAQYREILEETILPYELGNARPQDEPALLLVSSAPANQR